jgi:acyl-CoA reductase-like NAD-dependent aldehyde dehydrogenase/nicotinamidase-related amidase
MNKALIVIDVQNYFLNKESLYPPKNLVTPEIARTLDYFRENKITIFHVQTRIDKNLKNKMPHWNENLAKLLQEGKSTYKVPSSVEPHKKELVFYKSFYSGFSNSNLEHELRKILVDELYIIGLYTHACIRHTAIDAYTRGFRVNIIENAIASDDTVQAELSQKYLAKRGINFLSLEDLNIHSTLSLKADAIKKDQRENRIDIRNNKIIKKNLNALKSYESSWVDMGLRRRQKVLLSTLKIFKKNKKNLINSIVKDVGKTLSLAEEEFLFTLQLMSEALLSPENLKLKERFVPHGIVAIITPWNNPLALPLGKIIPALLQGNTVAWKPAEEAPLTSKLILKLLKESKCSKAIHMFSGGAELGDILIRSREVSAVSFTGSEKSGRLIAIECAARFKPFQGELGGNNALLLFTKKNIEKNIASIVQSVYAFSGQRCTAIRRIIVHKKIKEIFLRLFIKEVKSLESSFTYPYGILSPIISLKKRNELIIYVKRAILDGSNLLLGGGIPANKKLNGSWMEPTLIEKVDPQSKIAQQELFGPIAILYEANSIEEAMEIANQSRHGLLTVLLSDDQKEINFYKKHANTGIVSVNQFPIKVNPAMAFSGWKASGIGLPEHGVWDQIFYNKIQSLYE